MSVLAFGPPRTRPRPPAPRVRDGDLVWLWQDVDGWIPAAVVHAGDPKAADPWVTLSTGDNAYAGDAEERVRLGGEARARGRGRCCDERTRGAQFALRRVIFCLPQDTVLLGRAPGDAPPAAPPPSVLPGEPLVITADDLRLVMKPRRPKPRAMLHYGVDFAAFLEGGQAGLRALRDMPGGAVFARYDGWFRNENAFDHIELYRGPGAADMNRGTHAVSVPNTSDVLDGWDVAREVRALLAAGRDVPAALGEGAASVCNSSRGDARGRKANCLPEWRDCELWLVTKAAGAPAGDELLWDYDWITRAVI